MTFQAIAPWPVYSRQMLERMMAAMLIVLFITQSLTQIFPASFFEKAVPAAPTLVEPTAESPFGLTPVTHPLPPLWLPPELAGKPEVIALRTANSATFDMGNNTFATVQETVPLHYQDQHGAWQRINPAFVETAAGWLNGTNSVRTLTSKRQSQATIAAGEVSLRWQPDALVIVDHIVDHKGDRSSDRDVIAQPLPTHQAAPVTVSTDGTIARYTASWDMSGLQDQWQSAPGRSEYTMRLPELPDTAWWQGTPEALDLRIRLQINPGTSIEVEGQPVTLSPDAPLVTTGPIVFVGDDGEAMMLQPPRTFEQNNPMVSVEAEYLLSATEDAETTIELRVRTPWAWLAAPERNFPVILDPVFQMRSGTYGANATYLPANGNFNNLFDTRTLRLGRYWELVSRPIVRFNLPIMPFGTSITKAYLHAVPDDINNGEGFDFTRNYLKTRVAVHALDADWQTTPNGPTFDPNPLPPGSQFMQFSRGAEQQKGVTWDVTSAVQKWNQYPGVPVQNPGLIMIAENEFCTPQMTVANVTVQNLQCGAFFFNDVATSWTQEELDVTHLLTSQDSLYLSPHSTSSGIRLVVYFNGPTLNHDSVSPAQGAALPLPPGDAPYFKTSNVYTIPPLPDDKWHAFVARSRGSRVGQNPPAFGQLSHIPLKGATPLALRRSVPGETPFEERLLRSVKPAEDTASYILFNGRGNPSADFDQNNLLYVESSAGISGASGYEVFSMPETGSLPSPLGTVYETAYAFDSAQSLALWNLELPTPSQAGGATSRVMLEIYSDSTNLGLSLGNYGRHFQAQIINSSNQADLPTSPQINAHEAWNYTRAEFSWEQGMGQVSNIGPVRMNSTIFSPGFGWHALTLAYNGPEIIANDNCDPQLCNPPPALTGDPGTVSVNAPSEANAPAENIQVKYIVKIRVLTCPSGTFPLKNGKCQPVECPTTAVVPPNSPLYQEAGNLGLWSFGGWQADGATMVSPETANVTPPPFAPLIGPTGRGLPTVAVLEGRVRYNTATNPDTVTIEGDSTILLIQCHENQDKLVKFFQVYEGPMNLTYSGFLQTPSFVPKPNDGGHIFFSPWQASDTQFGDVQNQSISITPPFGKASGNAILRRRTGMEQATLKDMRFDVTWSVTVDGYPSLTSTVQIRDDSQTPDKIASLAFGPGDQFEMDIGSPDLPPITTEPRRFEAVRVLAGTVTQDARMGGATKPVRALILPPSSPMSGDATTYCPRSCIDVRAPDDTRTKPNRKWEMPDIHTNTQPGMVAMSTPGNLTVFSKDQPNADPNAANFTQQFSFDAFDATVSVEQDYCLTNPDGTPKGEITLVIKGETRIAMPNMGSPGDTAGITANFKLCDLPPDGLGLRSVHLSFDSPVGLPIGTSGLFLTGLEGEVSIYPEYTEIRFGLDFQTEPTGPGKTMKGHGTVFISTLGLFEFQGGAKLLGVVNAEGRLWVAWNPIDIGFNVEVSVGSWLRGNAHAHMWKGRGFYNYTWLPDNNEMHFTAGVSAEIVIEEGAIIDAELLVLPWDDIVFGVRVEFGEFCTNNSCTTYEWGIKGAFVIAGYDVGLYFGFEEGLDFILGNDDHILIDQYGAALASTSAVTANHVTFAAAPEQVGDTAIIPFNVSSSAEQILAGLSWQAGSPTLTLIDPSGVEITGNNATAHQAEIINQPNATYIGVQMPQGGAWQAKLSNLSEAGIEHYKFIYLANKGAPGTPDNRGRFTSLGNGPDNGPVQPNNGMAEIQWEVPNDTPPTAKISLYISRTEAITGNLHIGVPIVKNLPFDTGHYSWDTRKFLNGSYKIRAVVDDGVNDLPEGQISQPDDPCVAVISGLPPARAFDPNRFPGTVEFTSAGTIQIMDATAPAAPTGLSGSASDSALMVRWTAPADVDVSGYLLRWGPRRPDALPQGFLPQNQALVLAGEELVYQIGAVTNDTQYGVDIAALDVNGNQSPFTPAIFLTPNGGNNPVPAVPTNLALTSRTSTSASFAWQAGVGPAAASYELTYALAGATSEVGTLQTNATNATISDLAIGASYDVRVRALNSEGWASAYVSETVRVLVTDGVDSNGDGMAEDWAAAFGITNANGDPDRDGLSNAAEYAAATNPTAQDSDGDGFSDMEETTAGTDPLNALLYGTELSQPRLVLEKTRLRFYAKQQEGGAAALQQVGWANVGGGNLALQASTTQAWIQASIAGDKVQVGVDHSQLTPGFYSGVVQLMPAQGSDQFIGDPACIRVNTWVAPADNDIPSQKQSQTISFPTLADRRINTPPFAVTATASSGLPVNIVSSTPSACTIDDNTVTLVSEAVCTLIASQPGNDQYSAAPDVIRSFTILPEDAVYTTYLTWLKKNE